MNHIARLTDDLAGARARIERIEDAVQAFWAHLATDKFAGFEPDGGRKDWIATRDVEAWLATTPLGHSKARSITSNHSDSSEFFRLRKPGVPGHIEGG